MSTVTSRVKRALDEKSTADSKDGSDQRTITEEQLTEAVKMGVTEALENRDEKLASRESAKTEGTEPDEDASGRRITKTRLLAIGAIASILYYLRRRRNDQSSESMTGQSNESTTAQSSETDSDESAESTSDESTESSASQSSA